jgi:hypothetical protein
MRNIRRYWMNNSAVNCSRLLVLGTAALLVACDGDGGSTAPGSGPSDGAGGAQLDLGTLAPTSTSSTTEWLTRALNLGVLLSDNPAATSFAPQADDDPGDDPHNVVPFQFDPNKTGLVRATWLRGTGCPTNATFVPFGGSATPFTDPGCPPPAFDDKDKKFDGLLLSKIGPTANFASAGADIKNVKGLVLTELGWDIRAGSHCGNGAPRWNVTTMDGVTHFIGCNTGVPVLPLGSTATPTPSHPWVRQRWNAAELASPAVVFPPFDMTTPGGTTVQSISILFDEGQDTPFVSGEAFLDNIDINGALSGRGPGD